MGKSPVKGNGENRNIYPQKGKKKGGGERRNSTLSRTNKMNDLD